MNIACQIRDLLGMSVMASAASMRSPSHTKRGTGRRAVQGDGTRTYKQRQAGAYGRGLVNWITRTQAAKMA